MTTYICYVEAYVSDTVEVEADSEYEAYDLAQQEFNDSCKPYSATGGYTYEWDNVEVTSVEEL